MRRGRQQGEAESGESWVKLQGIPDAWKKGLFFFFSLPFFPFFGISRSLLFYANQSKHSVHFLHFFFCRAAAILGLVSIRKHGPPCLRFL